MEECIQQRLPPRGYCPAARVRRRAADLHRWSTELWATPQRGPIRCRHWTG